MPTPYVVFRQSVLDGIERHTKHTGQDEAGGILVGPRPVQNIFLIEQQIPDEGRTICSPVTYRSDEHFLQSRLEQLRHDHPDWDYRGTWHKQPDSTDPSETDRKQAIEILRDPSYAINGVVIMPIVTLGSHKELHFDCHYMAREDEYFDRADFAVKSDDDRDLKAISALLARTGDTKESRHGKPIAQTRVAKELAKLKSLRLQASIRRLDQDTVGILIKLDLVRSLLAILPAEYPLNPPRLVLLQQNSTADVKWDASPWSSAYMLSDLVQQFLDSSQKVQLSNTTGSANLFTQHTYTPCRF